MHTPIYDQLFNVFSTMGVLSDSLKQAIIENTNVLSIGKKKMLLSEGEKSDSIYFIVKGCLRIFYLDESGMENNTWFLFENELAISVYSFFTSQPGFEYIETLEDCVLIALKKDKLNLLYQNHLEFNIIGRKFTEIYYVRTEAQANALRTLSAKERHIALLKSHPEIFKRISLGHIASYLGISAETLSRIRRY